MSPSFSVRFFFSFDVILTGTDDPILTLVGCGIGVLVRMFFVLTVLLFRALRGGSPVPELEDETTVFVYAGEIAPPYEIIDEKKALDAVPVMENRA